MIVLLLLLLLVVQVSNSAQRQLLLSSPVMLLWLMLPLTIPIACMRLAVAAAWVVAACLVVRAAKVGSSRCSSSLLC
jgi:hypothetical protein